MDKQKQRAKKQKAKIKTGKLIRKIPVFIG
jgi:hypothetical protein